MRTRSRAEFPREKPGGRWKGGAERAVRSCGRCAWSRRGNLRSVSGVAAPPMAQIAAIIVPIGPTAHPSYRGSPLQLPCSGERRQGPAPIVLPSPYGPRMQTPRSAPKWRPTGARPTGAKGNATTEVLDQAVSPAPPPDLARQDDPDRDRSGPGLGRLGRAEAADRAGGAAQAHSAASSRPFPSAPSSSPGSRSPRARATACTQLLEDDGSTPAATGATGASGPSGATGVTGKTAGCAVRRARRAGGAAGGARPADRCAGHARDGQGGRRGRLAARWRARPPPRRRSRS